MPIESAIIARSQPYVITAAANEFLQKEASKGCTPHLSKNPLQLEPRYQPAENWKTAREDGLTSSIAILATFNNNIKLQSWMSKEHVLHWFRAERFVKLLSSTKNRIGFQIIGNMENISIEFTVHPTDSDNLRVAFNGEYPDCEITYSDSDWRFDGNIYFQDFYPLPPYHHLLTRSHELNTSPYESFIYALAKLPEDSQGFVQVLFEPAKHNWHQNVEALTDIEFLSKTIADPRSAYRIKQQLPSGDIRNMAHEVETKAHNDKPFYSVALRSGIVTKKKNTDLGALTSFSNLFQHGGRPLQYITEKEYNKSIPELQTGKMFQLCLTYRPGFLLNSSELSGLVHIPTIESFKERRLPLKLLENKTITLQLETISGGIKIGETSYAGINKPVYINRILRKTSTHIIGRSGSGKSTEMENMILQDIQTDNGITLIDPHGDTIKRLLHLIPEKKVDSTIYLDFGNPDWIPIWNPLKRIPNQDIGRTADNLVSSFKSVIKRNAWGDRLEHLLRNGIYGLLHLDDSSFYDLLVLFEQSKTQSVEKKYLTKMIMSAVDNVVAKRFWSKDFSGYRRDDFAPTHHKLSKLLHVDKNISLMLTQSDNLINFQEIMDKGKIILIDLSNISSDSRGILGSYLLSFIHNHSLARSKIATWERKPFNIYCDEAHIITTDTLEEMIIESRKFGINLTLAHQYLNQFNTCQRDALLSMGTTIIFNVDLSDARYFIKDLQEKVDAKDIAILKTGEAIARIGTEIVKMKTQPPISLPPKSFKWEIIKNSYENYYRKKENVEKHVRNRLQQLGAIYYEEPIIEELNKSGVDDERFTYDEFD
ncbi:type IV secretory system conjugative DNA transfer family protein [Bacteroidota bacterium]